MGLPTIYGIEPNYDSKTAREYDVEATKEMEAQEGKNEIIKETQEELKETQEELENLKFLQNSSNTIKEAIYNNPKLTKSTYQFTDQETYTNTNFSDKTDTYINMNTSFRYIKYNVSGAGALYNQLNEGNNFRTDSPKKVFETIKNRFVTLWFNKRVNEQWKLETFEIKNDTDMLYVIGFFQTFLKDKLQDSSNIDFRIWPKTLGALLDDNNKLEYIETKQVNKDIIPEEAEEVTEQSEGIPQGGKEIISEQIIDETSEETQDIKPNIQPDIQEITIPANNLPLSSESDPQLSSESNLLTSSESNLPLSPYFKDNLKQDLDLNTKITNIDKLISEYPDVAKLIKSMKNIGIDYENAKTSNNEIDVDRVVAILNEIEYRNVADMQKIVDMTWEMNLSGEQAVKFIIFYKMFERKEIINPDLTSIDTLRASYKYNSDKNPIEKAKYEDTLLQLYTTKTDEKEKRIIMKEYTRTILEKNFTEHNIIWTDNQGKKYNINNTWVGVFYNQETNEFIINYITADKLPRKDEFQTVIFSKEDFLSKPEIIAPEIVEAPKTSLIEFAEFVDMKKNLDTTINALKIKYNGVCDFSETQTNSYISKKIMYQWTELVEIGIEVNKDGISYFRVYERNGEIRSSRSSKTEIILSEILELIDFKIEKLNPNVAEWLNKENNENNLT